MSTANCRGAWEKGEAGAGAGERRRTGLVWQGCSTIRPVATRMSALWLEPGGYRPRRRIPAAWRRQPADRNLAVEALAGYRRSAPHFRLGRCDVELPDDLFDGGHPLRAGPHYESARVAVEVAGLTVNTRIAGACAATRCLASCSSFSDSLGLGVRARSPATGWSLEPAAAPAPPAVARKRPDRLLWPLQAAGRPNRAPDRLSRSVRRLLSSEYWREG